MSKTVERKRTMTLNLSEEEMSALEQLARKHGLTKSALIRLWIHQTMGLGLGDSSGHPD